MIRKMSVLVVALAAVGVVVSALSAADQQQPAASESKPALQEAPKFEAKCPVSGAAAKKEQSTKYKEKEVYFCCEKCKGAFEEDNKKFIVKANHQLVHTKQFRQAKCPLSGGALNKEMVSKVNGVEVQFCCDKCKGKVDAGSGEEQLTLTFADDAFKKGFVATEPKKK